jgi:hypothetical protein
VQPAKAGKPYGKIADKKSPVYRFGIIGRAAPYPDVLRPFRTYNELSKFGLCLVKKKGPAVDGRLFLPPPKKNTRVKAV